MSVVTKYGFLLSCEPETYDSAKTMIMGIVKRRETSPTVDSREYLRDIKTFSKAWSMVGGFFSHPLRTGRVHSATVLSVLISLCDDDVANDKTILWKQLLSEVDEDMETVAIPEELLKRLNMVDDVSTSVFISNLVRRYPTSTMYGIMDILFAGHKNHILEKNT